MSTNLQSVQQLVKSGFRTLVLHLPRCYNLPRRQGLIPAFSANVRHETTLAGPWPKNVLYRMSGLRRGVTEQEILRILRCHHQEGEEHIRPIIDILPACGGGVRDTSSIAILKFRSDQQPAFLAKLVHNPLGDITFPYDAHDNAHHGTVILDRHFHGFTQLYPTQDNRPISADIIAITGMDGHAYGSWMSKEANGAMWLRDFLSRDLSHCRTMVYGYHSKLLAPNLSQLKEYGRLFMLEMEKIRDTAELQQRPLIFICHSYGGIVLSYSLLHASTATGNPSRNSIYKSTYGMLFFGTPHRGSPKEDVLKMVEHAYPNRIPALMQTKPESGSLMSQLELFMNIIGDRQIGSFYETEPTPTPAQDRDGRWKRIGPPVLQVGEPSATLQFPGFRERKVPVNANHTNMVKFNSQVDPTYTTALKMLREFARDAPKVVRHRYDPPSVFSKAHYTVPFTRSTNFFGREDILARLEEIYDSLDHHHRAALTGLGGIGKSAIAINYARRHKKRHPDASIYWVQASTAARFSQSYREIAETLQLKGRDEPKADVLRLVYDHLSDEKNGRWLIMLDNADDRTLFQSTTQTWEASNNTATDPNQPYRSLSSYLPQGHHGSFLITSRDRGVAEDFAGTTSSIVAVHALDEINSVQLLRQRSGDKQSPDDDATDLVRSLDNIPLAVTQAAAFISNGATSISRYISLYRKGLKHSKEHGTLDIPVPQAVSVTWQISFDTIRKQHPSSIKLFSLMSVLHNDDVPDFLFTENMPKYEGDRSLFERDITPLLRFSLIIIDGENFDMHRLVQLATRTWLAANHQLHQRVREARDLVANAFPDISAGFENWKECLALLPHAEATLALDAGPEDLRQLKQKGKLLYNMAYYEYIKGDHEAALKHSVAAKEAQSQFLKDDDKQVVLTKTLIFRLFSELGQGEKAIHEVDSELSGLHHSNAGHFSNEYFALLEERARIMLDVGKIEEAEAGARNALRLMTAQDGAPEVHKLDAKRTMARAISFQGEPEQAEELFRQVLARRKQLWSLNHVDTLKSVVDLAQCLANQGRYEEAFRHFKIAVEGLKKFSDTENTLAQRVEKLWEEAREESRQRGWSRLKRNMQAAWRRTRLRIFGSPRAALPSPAMLGAVPISARVRKAMFGVLVFLVAMLLALSAMSLQQREELMGLPHRLREEWKKEDRRLSEKMKDNDALDRSQDEKIQRLEREIQDEVRKLQTQIERIKRGD